MKYIIFDIDGVLADCSHRLHFIEGEKKDYDSFYSNTAVSGDTAIMPGVAIFRSLYEMILRIENDAKESEWNSLTPMYKIAIITGRNEYCKEETIKWLDQKIGLLRENKFRLVDIYFRPSNDWRPADLIKEDIIKKHIGFENILFAFDDDDKINEMYAKHGVMCYKPNITRNL